jgi:hypothetical protein
MSRDMRSLLLPGAAAAVLASTSGLAAQHEDRSPARIDFEISPRVCTLAKEDAQCDLAVTARWHAREPESLCLVVRERPDVRHCWEQYASGEYAIGLQFSTDLQLELRDPDLRRVLAARALRVIREILQYRHRRREPWNVLF